MTCLRLPLALAMLSAAAPLACGQDSNDAPLSGLTGRLRAKVEGTDNPRAELLAKLEAGATLDPVLALLDIDAAAAQQALGAHELAGKCKYESTPQKVEPEREFPQPRLPGDLIRERQRYDEVITLRMGSTSRPLQYDFRQSLGPKNSIEAIAVGEQVYTRKDASVWYRQPAALGVHESWLADAYHLPRDMVFLGGQALGYGAERSGESVSIKFTLAHPDKASAALAADPYANVDDWRKQAKLVEGSGEVVLDSTRGVWQSFRFDFVFEARDPEKESAQVRFHCEGSLRSLPAGSKDEFAVPEAAQDLPEPERYSFRAQELLRGLARPR